MAAHHHGSDMSTSPRAVLYHTGANLCTILHTTVYFYVSGQSGPFWAVQKLLQKSNMKFK